MNDPREFLAPGAPGWRKRELAAKARAVNSEEVRQKNEVRRKRREFEDALTAHVSKAKAEGRDKDEAYREFMEAHQCGEAPQAAPESEKAPSEPESQSGDDVESLPDPKGMDRDALIAELQAAGQKVHPASKDATLRRKVEEIR